MSGTALGEFKDSAALSLGVELELQLVSRRDYDLTRGATDLLGSMDYDGRFGEIKLEITESMIEISTMPQSTVDGIASDLGGQRSRPFDRQWGIANADFDSAEFRFRANIPIQILDTLGDTAGLQKTEVVDEGGPVG